ncbi:hypothetical protein HYH03_005342 [Edaphochlamys debaryana]|uniref:Cyclic nucleotide-binding domain-containing protein n=1 Tax=Edaphochlamys debaryana TaxID=47281 RepID=A0A835Y5S1_9CHLO|nr:hypothetical protein HYH03_005342 [Edaphochlamys debaryana]|eukprot:KAG2496518.1 hypothetical protein HYH03_005342 [Edaphochlamys debaryana]
MRGSQGRQGRQQPAPCLERGARRREGRSRDGPGGRATTRAAAARSASSPACATGGHGRARGATAGAAVSMAAAGGASGATTAAAAAAAAAGADGRREQRRRPSSPNAAWGRRASFLPGDRAQRRLSAAGWPPAASNFTAQWSALQLALVLWVAVAVPLEIGFQTFRGVAALTAMSWVVSVCFGLDVLVRFRTTFTTPQGEVVRSPGRIATRYLAGLFVLDVAAALPLQAILGGTGLSEYALWFQLLKLPRIFRLSELLALSRTKYDNLMVAGRLLGFMLLVTLVGDRPDTFNNVERVLAILLLIIGTCFFAITVSAMSLLVSNLWSMAARHEQREALAREALEYAGAAPEVHERVSAYFRRMADVEHPGAEGVALLSELPAGLHAEVQLFAFCERPFVWRLSQRLRIAAFMPRDVIYEYGSVGHEVYIIWKGAVALMAPGGAMAALQCAGDHFGELGLMTANTPRPHKAVALQPCDTVVLGRWDLLDVMRDFPDSAALVSERSQVQLEDHEAGPAIWAAALVAGGGGEDEGPDGPETGPEWQEAAAEPRRRPRRQRKDSWEEQPASAAVAVVSVSSDPAGNGRHLYALAGKPVGLLSRSSSGAASRSPSGGGLPAWPPRLGSSATRVHPIDSPTSDSGAEGPEARSPFSAAAAAAAATPTLARAPSALDDVEDLRPSASSSTPGLPGPAQGLPLSPRWAQPSASASDPAGSVSPSAGGGPVAEATEALSPALQPGEITPGPRLAARGVANPPRPGPPSPLPAGNTAARAWGAGRGGSNRRRSIGGPGDVGDWLAGLLGGNGAAHGHESPPPPHPLPVPSAQPPRFIPSPDLTALHASHRLGEGHGMATHAATNTAPALQQPLPRTGDQASGTGLNAGPGPGPGPLRSWLEHLLQANGSVTSRGRRASIECPTAAAATAAAAAANVDHSTGTTAAAGPAAAGPPTAAHGRDESLELMREWTPWEEEEEGDGSFTWGGRTSGARAPAPHVPQPPPQVLSPQPAALRQRRQRRPSLVLAELMGGSRFSNTAPSSHTASPLPSGEAFLLGAPADRSAGGDGLPSEQGMGTRARPPALGGSRVVRAMATMGFKAEAVAAGAHAGLRAGGRDGRAAAAVAPPHDERGTEAAPSHFDGEEDDGLPVGDQHLPSNGSDLGFLPMPFQPLLGTDPLEHLGHAARPGRGPSHLGFASPGSTLRGMVPAAAADVVRLLGKRTPRGPTEPSLAAAGDGRGGGTDPGGVAWGPAGACKSSAALEARVAELELELETAQAALEQSRAQVATWQADPIRVPAVASLVRREVAAVAARLGALVESALGAVSDKLGRLSEGAELLTAAVAAADERLHQLEVEARHSRGALGVLEGTEELEAATAAASASGAGPLLSRAASRRGSMSGVQAGGMTAATGGSGAIGRRGSLLMLSSLSGLAAGGRSRRGSVVMPLPSEPQAGPGRGLPAPVRPRASTSGAESLFGDVELGASLLAAALDRGGARRGSMRRLSTLSGVPPSPSGPGSGFGGVPTAADPISRANSAAALIASSPLSRANSTRLRASTDADAGAGGARELSSGSADDGGDGVLQHTWSDLSAAPAAEDGDGAGVYGSGVSPLARQSSLAQLPLAMESLDSRLGANSPRRHPGTAPGRPRGGTGRRMSIRWAGASDVSDNVDPLDTFLSSGGSALATEALQDVSSWGGGGGGYSRAGSMGGQLRVEGEEGPISPGLAASRAGGNGGGQGGGRPAAEPLASFLFASAPAGAAAGIVMREPSMRRSSTLQLSADPVGPTIMMRTKSQRLNDARSSVAGDGGTGPGDGDGA